MPGQSKSSSSPKAERIAKVMARAGVGSRRQVERWIEEGRVRVNGEVLETPAFKVSTTDKVQLNGKDIPIAEPVRVWKYHKPAGLVTTHKDEKGRDTVFDKLPSDLPRVISVGRLDLNSEGLLLLTNDGEVSRALELPSNQWTRNYRVRAHGRPDEKVLASLKKGITIDGVRYGSIKATLEKNPKQATSKTSKSNCWLHVSLQEGKNREIRKVLEHIGLKVNRLIRVSYGPFQLGKLPVGQVEEVTQKVLKTSLPKDLKDKL